MALRAHLDHGELALQGLPLYVTFRLGPRPSPSADCHTFRIFYRTPTGSWQPLIREWHGSGLEGQGMVGHGNLGGTWSVNLHVLHSAWRPAPTAGPGASEKKEARDALSPLWAAVKRKRGLTCDYPFDAPARYEAKGQITVRDGEKWEQALESNIVQFEVVGPAPPDRPAYDALTASGIFVLGWAPGEADPEKLDAFLRDHPRSSYTPYVLLERYLNARRQGAKLRLSGEERTALLDRLLTEFPHFPKNDCALYYRALLAESLDENEAARLYEQVIARFPESPWAREAKHRLRCRTPHGTFFGGPDEPPRDE